MVLITTLLELYPTVCVTGDATGGFTTGGPAAGSRVKVACAVVPAPSVNVTVYGVLADNGVLIDPESLISNRLKRNVVPLGDN